MDLLDRVVEYYGIKNPLVVKQLFIKFMNFVLEKNKLFNLTAIEDEEEFVLKHIADSLSLIKFVEEESSNQNPVAIDIGSGFGAPGIFIKIAMPNMNMFLNDSNKKKCNFMTEAVKMLGISSVNVVCERAEVLGKKEEFRERFDFVFARAVDSLNVLCEYALPLLKTGGVFLAQKGYECEDEINSASNAVELLGGKIYRVEKFVLPFSDEKRSIVMIKKIRQTPSNFPRNTKQIIKKPL
jgi:16S rRNA (guanine527-N7)-methyltransferase